jgi:hypothetical protein
MKNTPNGAARPTFPFDSVTKQKTHRKRIAEAELKYKR